jgi:hypothetical protein
MFDLILSIALGAALAIVLTVLLVIQRKRTKETLLMLIDAELAKYELQKALQVIAEEQQTKEVEQTDGFLKFISDSRDWAFSYIEDVQQSLETFDKKISHIIDYYSTYAETEDRLHIEAVNKISEAYQDLKSKLPKDDGKV